MIDRMHENCCENTFGKFWISPMSKILNISPRALRHWRSSPTDHLPDNVGAAIRKVEREVFNIRLLANGGTITAGK